jgi:hypothetical protein
MNVILDEIEKIFKLGIGHEFAEYLHGEYNSKVVVHASRELIETAMMTQNTIKSRKNILSVEASL